MMRRFGLSTVIALALAVPALRAQAPARSSGEPSRPPTSSRPWPADDVLQARRIDAEGRQLFQSDAPLDITLRAEFRLINRERTPNNDKRFPATLTVGGTDLPVTLGSRGHLRLKSSICDFVPLRIGFTANALAKTVFEGQSRLKLGTHCRGDADSDQYVLREHLAYRLANLVTPLSFRARLARATYIEARSNAKLSTHYAIFLEQENDVARRLGGRDANVPHLLFSAFDPTALTTMMMVEYMLGNTDYSIWTLHNVVVVQDKRRRFYPIPYDFDLSGMVNAPYAAPDPRLFIARVTDRLYRGPCRPLEELIAAAEPFRSRRADMFAAIEATPDLAPAHRREVRDYLESFFDRLATPQWIKRTFVDNCPANRQRV